MRQPIRSIQRTARALRRVAMCSPALLILTLSAPVYAQSTSAVLDGNLWVNTTLVAVATVFALWVGAVSFFLLARKFRWMSPHRHSRVSRAVQVTFGGLLLLAFFLPYLAFHHPIVAAALLVVSGLVLVAARGRRADAQMG
jgi:hypothetical protein